MHEEHDNDDWQYDTSYYSASDWGYEKQTEVARKNQEQIEKNRKETEEQRKQREQAERAKAKREEERKKRLDEARQAAAKKMREQAEQRRKALEKELEERKNAEAYAAKQAEEREARRLEEQKEKERLAEEQRKREEEERRIAEEKFNSPQQVGDITIPAPSDRDKKWLAEFERIENENTYRRGYLPSGMSARRHTVYEMPTSLWQLNHMINNFVDISRYTSQLYYDAVTFGTDKYPKLLKHYGFDITYNKSDVLNKCFQDGNKTAFDKMVELGACPKTAMERYRGLDQIRFARFAGIDQSHWEKQTDQSILHRTYETDENDVLTIRTSYNFASRKIKTITLINDKYASACMESFSQQDTDTDINMAFEKLKEMGGNPTPPGGFIQKSPKTASTSVPFPKAP